MCGVAVQVTAQHGEEAVIAAFSQDPYGCRGQLHGKKNKRNPFAVSIPYMETAPELRDLLRYCGSSLFKGSLPWRPVKSRNRKFLDPAERG